MKTTPELLAELRAWLNELCPGQVPSHLVIHFHTSAVPLQIPFGPALPAPLPSASQPASADERGGGLSPCILDILTVLRDVGKPLTTTRLQEEMSKRGMDWNPRTIAGYLARLVEDGTLENRAEKPRGYCIPKDSAS